MRPFLALTLALAAVAAPAQISVVQQAPGHGQGANVTFAFAAAPAVRNLLVVGCSYYNIAPYCAAPDASWHEATRAVGNGNTGVVVWWHAVAAGEANSYSFGNANSATSRAYELSGTKYWAPVNQAAALGVSGAVTAQAAPALTPAVAGTLAMAFLAGDDATATGASSGWTFLPSSDARHSLGAATRDALTADTATPVANTFTVSGANTIGLAVAALLIAPNDPTPIPPHADMGFGGYSTIVGLPVQFDGSASYDAKLLPLTYAWSFGDGGTSPAVSPSHLYTTAGSYTVSLTLTNGNGQTATVSQTAIVQAGCSGVALGDYGALNGFVPSPADAWHQDISAAPVDPLSGNIMTAGFGLNNAYLHPDFGGNGAYGIPYTVVDSRVTGFSAYALDLREVPADEMDLVNFPIPPNLPIEGGPADCSLTGDNHTIVFDKATCTGYETYHSHSCSTATPRYTFGTTVLWDFTKTERRPFGMTSVDAAGMSIFEGLVRYDEIVAGHIDHAIRFTAEHSKQGPASGYFVYPASHGSGDYGTGVDLVMGQPFRLKASVDISGFPPQAKVIATAMKKYGMKLADKGGNLFFQGTPDPRWDDDQLNVLKTLRASDFEAVDVYATLASSYPPGGAALFPQGGVMDAANHPAIAPPTNALTASAATIAPGQSVTLTPTVSANASYSYIDKLGLVRPGVPLTVHPLATTTYTLTSRNANADKNYSGQFTPAISSVTVTVTAPTTRRPLYSGSSVIP